jgi:hypothetical protein
MKIRWPAGKRFAFTVFDDTDLQVPGNFEEVYKLLYDLGFKTTKSAWPLEGERAPLIGGATLENLIYREFVLDLQRKGFEIGWHTTTYHGVPRDTIARGLDRFRDVFGHYPVTMSNHADSEEAIYWGDARLSGLNRMIYNIVTRGRCRNAFFGHRKESPFFWGDLCCKRIRYIRNFITADINTLSACPIMPYHDPARPYANAWYASSEGPEIGSFIECINEKNQDRLEEEGGACIMYTHFACGFQNRGRLNARFSQLMERLARKGGWYVPVGTLLDYLAERHGGLVTISNKQRAVLERQWLLHKLRIGGTS